MPNLEEFQDDGSEVLDNPQHEKFAQLVAGGMDKTEAYLNISPEVARESAWSMGARMFGIVCGRVRHLQRLSATKLVLSMQERREFHARVVRVKVHTIDLEKDGDLVQAIEYNEETGAPKKITLPGKRECIMDDAKLSGELPDKPAANITLHNTVNVVAITEDRRQKLIEMRRQANERLRLRRQAKDAEKSE